MKMCEKCAIDLIEKSASSVLDSDVICNGSTMLVPKKQRIFHNSRRITKCQKQDISSTIRYYLHTTIQTLQCFCSIDGIPS